MDGAGPEDVLLAAAVLAVALAVCACGWDWLERESSRCGGTLHCRGGECECLE